AKSGLPLYYWERGFQYVAVNFLTLFTPLLIFPASYFAVKTKPFIKSLFTVVMAWGFPLYGIVSTGDFMAMGRFLLPGLTFIAILWAWMLNDIWTKSRLHHRIFAGLLGAIVIVAGALPAWNHHLIPENIRERFHFRYNTPEYRSEFTQWQFQCKNTAKWILMGKQLKKYTDTHFANRITLPSLVTDTIGAMGYYSELFIHDRCGLVSPEVTRIEVEHDQMLSPGHDRYADYPFFLKHQPSILFTDLLTAGSLETIARQIDGSAAALRNGLPELQLEKRYVPDFVRLKSEGEDQHPTLLVWRIILPEEEWKTVWKDFRSRLLELYAAAREE
ncbi:MAG: hypothetical protein KJ645_08810, partial [Planctomycetes bacterium]|nr:hypothetical protein [Planctomycetota bacterium]